MALNISPRGWRSNVGRPDGLTAGRSEITPALEDSSCDFVEAHPTSENSREGRFTILRRGLATVEKNRSVLEKGVAATNLSGSHELPAINNDLASYGSREARRRTLGLPALSEAKGSDGRTGGRNDGVDVQ